jgi:molecular chaperone HscA
MLQDAIGASQEDMALRSLREAQVDGRRLLDATETALLSDAALLSDMEIRAIRQAMFVLGDMLETDAPLPQLREASAALGSATDGFAAKRMNASISKALAGRSMDSLA